MASHTGYYVYIVECEDGSYYTGITTDVTRRMSEHLSREGRCARYTRVHRVVGLVGLWTADDRSSASRLECRIKRLSRDDKDRLIAHPELAADIGPADARTPVDAHVPVDVHVRQRLWDDAQAPASRSPE